MFFFNDPPPTEISTLSLHDALPISRARSPRAAGSDPCGARGAARARPRVARRLERSEEHTSELQSRQYLVCRLLLEKKKYKNNYRKTTAWPLAWCCPSINGTSTYCK